MRSEGYHIIGVHPELLSVIDLEAGNSRHGFFGDHGMAVSPFEVKRTKDCGIEEQIKGIRALPATFPTVAEVLPRFGELVAGYRRASGELTLPDGVTVRTLLQRATRDAYSQGTRCDRAQRRPDDRQPGLVSLSKLVHDDSGRRGNHHSRLSSCRGRSE